MWFFFLTSMTIDDVRRLALAQSRGVAMAAADVDITEQLLRATRGLDDPIVSTTNSARIGASGVEQRSWGGVTQPLPSGGSLALGVEHALTDNVGQASLTLTLTHRLLKG